MTPRPRIRVLFALLAVATAFAATVAAQPAAAQPAAAQPGGRAGGPPRPPQNLQILPKDIPGPELVALMRSFTTALGVQCNYCHVAEPGRNDFASDDKMPKKTARVMMRMAAQINETIAGGVGKPAAEVTRVECATCHRGEAIPKLPPAAPPAARP
jgi:hypothetical protein